MLGKTNITALSEGGIVTEVKDFKWVQMQSGVYGNFVKAICQDGRLVGITADGSVVHTVDGEVWKSSRLDFVSCGLKDIEWDGSRFLLAGSCTEDGKTVGLILSTKDLEGYERLRIWNCDDTEQAYDEEYCGVYFVNRKYCIVALRTGGSRGSKLRSYMYVTDLGDGKEPYNKVNILPSEYYPSDEIVVTKDSGGMLLSIKCTDWFSSKKTYCVEVYRVDSSEACNRVHRSTKDADGLMWINIFECKDALFYEYTAFSDNYDLVKVLPSNEEMTLCTGQNFAFVDGVYFDGSQLFINNHEMLVVKKGESLADKTVADLIEIAPEMTMRCITKAFGQLFIFGNQGVILKSSVETGNEEAIAVQTISAKKALADAKAYTDGRYTELEARIAALEAKGWGDGDGD